MTLPSIEIVLDGALFAVAGNVGAVSEAISLALITNGGRSAETAERADILVCIYPLLPADPAIDDESLTIAQVAAAMRARGKGRILFVLPALAVIPARRFPDLSVRAAAAYAMMRTMAMEWAPQLLVNAIGIGTIEDEELISGDRSFLGHVPLGRTGTLDEVAAAALFFCDPMNTYTTGQLLSVDGGWMAGYGRSF
jgi:NAD(P)-dependent dehydrogenase (short-subunit alcohol dehydrogenase family)